MIFNIAALDVPLEVNYPVCCNICKAMGKHIKGSANRAMRTRCTFCKTMKRIIDELLQLEVEGTITNEIYCRSTKEPELAY